MEVWLPVVGYEGNYEVSNLGRVRSLKFKRIKIMKQKVSSDNCYRINLYKNGKQETSLVHRLVCESFHPRVSGKNSVNHKDGNRLNNDSSNLEWVTAGENNNHAFDHGLQSTNKSIWVVNFETGEVSWFRSFSLASQYIGKNRGFISRLINIGKYEYKNFEFLIEKKVA